MNMPNGSNRNSNFKLRGVDELKEILLAGGWSCVIRSADGVVRTFSERGVVDLYHLLTGEPETLRGAQVVDKVVGKGAAALLALGRVSEVYAEVASTPAMKLLSEAGVCANCGFEVPYIVNRDRSGWCPVEKLCAEVNSPETILDSITKFLESKR
jgi:iron complex outermembrane receptor protein